MNTNPEQIQSESNIKAKAKRDLIIDLNRRLQRLEQDTKPGEGVINAPELTSTTIIRRQLSKVLLQSLEDGAEFETPALQEVVDKMKLFNIQKTNLNLIANLARIAHEKDNENAKAKACLDELSSLSDVQIQEYVKNPLSNNLLFKKTEEFIKSTSLVIKISCTQKELFNKNSNLILNYIREELSDYKNFQNFALSLFDLEIKENLKKPELQEKINEFKKQAEKESVNHLLKRTTSEQIKTNALIMYLDENNFSDDEVEAKIEAFELKPDGYYLDIARSQIREQYIKDATQFKAIEYFFENDQTDQLIGHQSDSNLEDIRQKLFLSLGAGNTFSDETKASLWTLAEEAGLLAASALGVGLLARGAKALSYYRKYKKAKKLNKAITSYKHFLQLERASLLAAETSGITATVAGFGAEVHSFHTIHSVLSNKYHGQEIDLQKILTDLPQILHTGAIMLGFKGAAMLGAGVGKFIYNYKLAPKAILDCLANPYLRSQAGILTKTFMATASITPIVGAMMLLEGYSENSRISKAFIEKWKEEAAKLQEANDNLEGEDDQENIDKINYSLLTLRSMAITLAIGFGGRLAQGSPNLSKTQLREVSRAETYQDLARLYGKEPVKFEDAAARARDIIDSRVEGEPSPLENLLIEDALKLDIKEARTSELETLLGLENTSKNGQKLREKIEAELDQRHVEIQKSESDASSRETELENQRAAEERKIEQQQQDVHIESSRVQNDSIELNQSSIEIETQSVSQNQTQLGQEVISSLKAEIQSQKAQSTVDAAKISELEAGKSKLEQTISESQTELTIKENQIRDLNEKIEDLQTELEAEIQSSNLDKAEALKQEQRKAQEKIEELQQEFNAKQQEANRKIEELIQDLATSNSGNARLKGKLDSANQSIKDLNLRLKAQEAEIQKSKELNSKIRENHRSEIERLKEQSSSNLELIKLEHQRTIERIKQEHAEKIEAANRETENSKAALEDALKELDQARKEAREILEQAEADKASQQKAHETAAEIIERAEAKAKEIIENQQKIEAEIKQRREKITELERSILEKTNQEAKRLREKSEAEANKILEEARAKAETESGIQKQRTLEEAKQEAARIKERAEKDILEKRKRAEKDIKELKEEAENLNAEAINKLREAQRKLSEAERKSNEMMENARKRSQEIIEEGRKRAETESAEKAAEIRAEARKSAREIRENARKEAERIKEEARKEAERIKEEARRETEKEKAEAQRIKEEARKEAETKSGRKRAEKEARKEVESLVKRRQKIERSKRHVENYRKELGKRRNSNRITNNTQNILDDLMDYLNPSTETLNLSQRIDNLIVTESMFFKHISEGKDFKITNQSSNEDINDMIIMSNFFNCFESLIKASVNANEKAEEQLAVGLIISFEKYPNNFNFDIKSLKQSQKLPSKVALVLDAIIKIREIANKIDTNDVKLPEGGLTNPANHEYFQALNKKLYDLPKEQLSKLFTNLLKKPELDEGSMLSILGDQNEQNIIYFLSTIVDTQSFGARFLRNLVRAYQLKNQVKNPLLTDFDYRLIESEKAKVEFINLNPLNLNQISEKINQLDLLYSIKNNIDLIKTIPVQKTKQSKLYEELHKILQNPDKNVRLKEINELISIKHKTLELKASNITETDITTKEELEKVTIEVIETLSNKETDLNEYFASKNGDTAKIISENLRFIHPENLEKLISAHTNEDSKLSSIQNFAVFALASPNKKLNLQLAIEYENRIFMQSMKKSDEIKFENYESCDLPNGKTLTQTIIEEDLLTTETLAKLIITQPKEVIKALKEKPQSIKRKLEKVKKHHLPENIKEITSKINFENIYKDSPEILKKITQITE